MPLLQRCCRSSGAVLPEGILGGAFEAILHNGGEEVPSCAPSGHLGFQENRVGRRHRVGRIPRVRGGACPAVAAPLSC